MKRMKRAVIVRAAIVACLIAALLGTVGAMAAGKNTHAVTYDVEFGQTEAREMLAQINDFRTGGDAWAYDSSNQKVSYKGLEPLVYDAELEKVAMQRAVELIVKFEHERPDGTSFSTAYDELNIGMKNCGENIAKGYPTQESAYEAWLEEDKPYSGQGHRRNMLSSNYNTIGIGHVCYKGVNYWVQEFAYKKTVVPEGAAQDEPASVTVNVLNSEEEGSGDGFSYTILSGGYLRIDKCSLSGDVVIPEKIDGYEVGEIGDTLFHGMEGVTSITLPATVSKPSYDSNPFLDCYDLEAIYVAPENPLLASVDGVLYSRDGRELLCYPAARKSDSYTTFEKTVEFGRYSFCQADALKDLYISNKEAEITEYTFSEVPNLTVHYLEGGSAERCIAGAVKNHYDKLRSAQGGPKFAVCSANDKKLKDAPAKSEFQAYSDDYNTKATEYDAMKHLRTADSFIDGIYAVYVFGGLGTCGNTDVTLRSIRDFLSGCRVYEKGASTPIDIHFFIYDVQSSQKEIAGCIESVFGDEISARVHICKIGFRDPEFPGLLSNHKSILNLCDDYSGTIPFVQFVTPEGEKYTSARGALEMSYFKETIEEMAAYSVEARKNLPAKDKSKDTSKDTSKKTTDSKDKTPETTPVDTNSDLADYYTRLFEETNSMLADLYKMFDGLDTQYNGQTPGSSYDDFGWDDDWDFGWYDEPTPTPTPKPVAKPAKQTISSVKSSAKGKLTVKWKKNTKADGYQIQYSLKSDFTDAKKVDISKNSTVSKTITGLKSGKKYYVRVRSYVLDSGGNKVYGTYSDKKSIKVK